MTTPQIATGAKAAASLQPGGGANGLDGPLGSSGFASVFAGRNALASASAVVAGENFGSSDQRLAPGAKEFAAGSLFGVAVGNDAGGSPLATGSSEGNGVSGRPRLRELEHGPATVRADQLFDQLSDPAADGSIRMAGEAASLGDSTRDSRSLSAERTDLRAPVIQLNGPAGRSRPSLAFLASLRTGSEVSWSARVRSGAASLQFKTQFRSGPLWLAVIESHGAVEVVFRASGLTSEGAAELGRRVRGEVARGNFRLSGLKINGHFEKGVDEQ